MKIPKAKPLIVQMPKEHNYRIEQGHYSGTIQKIVCTPRPNCHECGDILRIVFALNVPGKEQFVNLAKAEFDLNLEHGSELRNMLTRLLGKEALAALSGAEINLESLVGKTADVEVEHVITSKRDQYDYPFVRICNIEPPGTLVAVKAAEPEGQPKNEVSGINKNEKANCNVTDCHAAKPNACA